jgi:hypothetical protein
MYDAQADIMEQLLKSVSQDVTVPEAVDTESLIFPGKTSAASMRFLRDSQLKYP